MTAYSVMKEKETLWFLTMGKLYRHPFLASRYALPVSSTEREVGPDGLQHVLHYQPALDGIRALAVALVVVFHFGLAGMHGGFLGVDIFFGLSGFLITTLLVREHVATGTIRFLAFWTRRFRRLLPGLLVMVVVSIVASWALLPPSYFPFLGRDALSAIFYFANWHLIGIRASYFNSSIAPTILTHTWSLSIEEQFYWVWPLVIAVVMRFRRSWLFGACVVGAFSSAWVMNLFYGDRTNARVYFGTDTHVQGLLLGAAAAVLAWRLEQRISAPSQTNDRRWLALGLVSLVGILVVVRYAEGNSPFMFQGGFFAFGLLVAALILSLRFAPTSPLARVFGWAPMAYVGRVSYSIYLWHYPVYSLVTHYRTGIDGYTLFAVRLIATGALALVSYYVVELPIRRRHFPLSVRGLAPAVVVVAVVAVLTWAIGTNSARLVTYPPSTHTNTGPIVDSLTIGDSGIMTFTWATTSQREGAGVNDFSDGAYGCGLIGGTYPLFKGSPSVQNPLCQIHRDGTWPLRATWQRDIVSKKPDVVIVAAGRWEAHNQRIFRLIHSIDDASFRRMIIKSLDIIRESSKSVGSAVVLVTTPCAHSGETPWGNFYVADTAARIDAYNSLIRHYAAKYDLTVYDLGGKACPNGRFTYFIDDYMVRAPDGFHYSNGSGPVLGDEFWTFIRTTGLASEAFAQAHPHAQ